MPEVRERKKAWRRLAGNLFVLVSPDDRRELDARLSTRLGEYVSGVGARCILGFAALPDEPDLTAFFRRWLVGGGRLALPVWLGGACMTLRSVDDLGGQLRPGRGGILEPAELCPEIAVEELDLVVTPGRLFSESCARLGRGAGCYDALFGQGAVASVGVAYDFQIFPVLPTYEGDIPVDCIITPSRMLRRERDGMKHD